MMTNMKAIIVDDQKDCIDLLSAELQQHCPEIELVGVSQSVADAFQQINEKKPDLVFLDIELGTHTSFELLDFFHPVFFKVIFVTAYNEFAIKAFKYSALDYILKPFSSLDVLSAVELAKRNRMGGQAISLLKEQLLTHTIIPKLAVSTNQKVELIDLKEIIYFEADKNYTVLYTKVGKHVISKNIKELEMLLEYQGFYRPHKSFLMNLNHIKSYVTTDVGAITMSDGTMIPMSQRKKQPFLEVMSKLYRR